ncbi:MAG: ABC transporter permease [Actinomycetota bacterium]
MNGARQIWLVALREMRERSKSRAFRASLIIMILVVVAVIVVPALLERSGGAKDVGLSGTIPAELAGAIQSQSDAVGTKTRVHLYDTVATGEKAVRDKKISVLVVDARRLEWTRRADEQLRAVVTSAIQLVAIRERAAAAGISPDALQGVIAPVTVQSIELGQVAGRTPGDETAALIMTILLFYGIVGYGAMVLSGVVEEKTSRVVEVLLARMPARNLLAGKIAGIGLLGLAQMTVTVGAALIAIVTVKSFDVPAVRGPVLAWLILWFVLGYALYATVFGALGSLASRMEDAQSTTGPVTVVLVASYLVSFAAIGSPDTLWAKVVSFFPLTAPLAMPNRVAMGATAWWEPLLAATLTIGAVAALIQLGGRVYSGAVLHTGPTLKLRDVLRGTTPPAGGGTGARTRPARAWRKRLAQSTSFHHHRPVHR